MAKAKIVPIQFQERMINEIEDYIKEGLYSSKAEFVREAVRKLIIELRKDLFFTKIEKLKELSKKRGAKTTTPFLTKKEKDKMFEALNKS
ncbi:MAG: hypothetical protein GOU97_01455 [Nanoarchaeota archaeon]|nr:hypothetical protein [Nanoarchaeota archaeon]